MSSISTGALAAQAGSGDYVSISVLKMALDAQQSEGAQLVQLLQPQPQQPPAVAAGSPGALLDVYA